MMPLRSIATSFALLLISVASHADETFTSEDHFQKSASMPASTMAYLTRTITADKASACQAVKPQELFETHTVSLNDSTKALLVKPAHMCLCESNNCPMWIFRAKGNVSKPLWSSSATKTLEILDKKLNGYRKLKEASADETHGRESIWSWNKDGYVEIYKHIWIWDTEKICRLGEETTQLMDGQMIERTKKCPQN